MRPASRDVLIAGDGIVALATALACADSGLGVRLIGRRLAGAASTAAAGLLAPSLGDVTPEVRTLMVAARDRWPAYAERLSGATGIDLAVNTRGILEVATDAAEHERLLASAPAWAQRLDGDELARLEPALAGAHGALLHPRDGAVDNAAAMRALDAACASSTSIERVDDTVHAVAREGDGMAVETGGGRRYAGGVVVVAAGVWAPAIHGLPRELPVSPWRGQMLALRGATTRHCVAGSGGYLVPRGDRMLVGSTMERVGLEVATTDTAIATLRRTAARLVPPLSAASEADRWAGLRPMTPDLLPIVGPDPGEPRIIYGCGLSKNGILLAPLVGESIAAWCIGATPAYGLRPFSITRFEPAKS